MDRGAWWAAVHGVMKSQTWLSDFTFTFHFHALEKEMATHSSVLAWRIPGMAEPGGLLSMGSHGVGHDWSDLTAATAAVKFTSDLFKRKGSLMTSMIMSGHLTKSVHLPITDPREPICTEGLLFLRHSAKDCRSVCVLSCMSHVRLCDPMECACQAVCGILQARILEWVAISFSRASSWSRDWTQVSYVSCTGRQSGGMNKKQSIKIWKIQIY